MLHAFNTINSILFLIICGALFVFALIVVPPWKKIINTIILPPIKKRYYETMYVFAYAVFFLWFIGDCQAKALKRWYRRNRDRKAIRLILTPINKICIFISLVALSQDHPVKHLYHDTHNMFDNNISGIKEMPPVMSEQMN